MFSGVEAFAHGDENLRKQIVGEDGRPGGDPWAAYFYRALGTLTPSRGAEPRAGWARIPTLGLDYERRATAAYLSGWKEFRLSPQNVVDETRTRNPVGLREGDGGTRIIPPQVNGDSWARGTASQYQSREPMIPFALEAPVLLRRLVEKAMSESFLTTIRGGEGGPVEMADLLEAARAVRPSVGDEQAARYREWMGEGE